MDKILKLSSYVLLGISALIFILFFATDAINEDVLLIWTYILAGVAIGAVLIFSVMSLISRPKEAKGTLIGIGLLVVVMLVSYLIASDEIPQFLGVEKFDVSNSESKIIGGTLISVYVLSVIAVLGIIYTESIAKFLKK